MVQNKSRDDGNGEGGGGGDDGGGDDDNVHKTAGKSSKAVVLMVLIRAPATPKTSTNFPTVDAKAVIVIDDLNN